MWHEFLSSGRLVCRRHVVFSGVTLFVLFLLRFRLFAFTEAAVALRLIVLVASIFSFLEKPVYSSIFYNISFSLCMESTSHVFSYRMAFKQKSEHI